LALPLPAKGQAASMPPRTDHVGVEELIRRLVARSPAPPNPVGASASEDVLIDIEMDGVRYLLLRRMVPRPQAACSLSPRELEISRLVAKGHVNKTIAGVLDISCYTVDTYLRRIFAKLNVTSRAAMVARLSRDSLLDEFHPNRLADLSEVRR
jgi:DNA-binding CsgD family transcriptional regulator